MPTEKIKLLIEWLRGGNVATKDAAQAFLALLSWAIMFWPTDGPVVAMAGVGGELTDVTPNGLADKLEGHLNACAADNVTPSAPPTWLLPLLGELFRLILAGRKPA